MFRTKFRAASLLCAVGACLPIAMQAQADVAAGWLATDYNEDTTWEVSEFDLSVSPNTDDMVWSGSATKVNSATNFANINTYLSGVSMNLTGPGGDSFHEILSDAKTKTDAAFEFVFSPASFTGQYNIFETGGTGSGTGMRLYNGVLNFRFQASSTAFIEFDFDLSTVGSASDFYHVVGVIDSDSPSTQSGLFVNGLRVGGPGNGTTNISDWSGTDGSGLGKVLGTSPQKAGGNTTFQPFAGDLAIVRHYNGELLDKTAVANGFAATTGNRNTATVGWDAADYDSSGTWAVSEFDPGVTGASDIIWQSGSGTKDTGTTNFANVNAWVSNPSFVQGKAPGPGAGAFDSAIGSSFAANDTTFEIVFRPGDYDNEKHLLFEHGGNGQGVIMELEGSNLLFHAQDGTTLTMQFTEDLSSIATADNFFHVIGVVDTSDPNLLSGLFINGVQIGSLGNANAVSDWAGGDSGALGADVTGSTANGDVGGFTAFDGDIAIYRIYNDQAFDQAAVDAAYNALVPEPSSLALLGLGGLLIMRRRRDS